MSVLLRSEVAAEEGTARWEIRGFLRLRAEEGVAYDSEPLLQLCGGTFGIRILPGGDKHGTDANHAEGNVSVRLRCTGPELWAEYTIEAINKQPRSNVICSASMPRLFGGVSERRWGFTNFHPRSALVDPSRGFLIDEILTLEIKVKAWQDMLVTTERPAVLSPSPYGVPSSFSLGVPVGGGMSALSSSQSDSRGCSIPALAADNWEFFQAGEGTDVTVRAGPACVKIEGVSSAASASSPRPRGSVSAVYEESELGVGAGMESGFFRAHRGHLAARSAVLRTMLVGGCMREAGPDGEVFLGEDVEPKVAFWFLRFLYTDEIDENAWADDEALCHLTALAHKYEVKSLLDRCLARVVAQLTEETAAERLMMADHFQISGLRHAVLHFMCSTKTRLATVQGTSGFSRLAEQRPHLALAVLAHMAPPRPKRSAEDTSAEELPDDLESCRIVRLKGMCAVRGLATSGNKNDLIQRLRAAA